MPKLAANLTLLFTELPFLDRFGAARANGFAAVELLFPYDVAVEDIAARLAQTGLQLVLHNLPAGNWDAGERGMACDPARIAEFKAGVDLALAYAVALGVPQLHCMAGIVPPGVAPAMAHRTYVDNVRYAAGRLAAHGLRLLIEPINTRDMPGYFLCGSAQAAAVIAEVGASNLALQLDLYHLQQMGEDLAAAIRRYAPITAHMQLADSPGRHEPGTGEIDFAALFALIDGLGYGGWIGCEYRPLHDTVGGLSWRSALSA